MSAPGVSFGAAAAEYAAGRPSYPAEAVSWTLGPGGRTVVDVGAGTGKLTAELVRQGHRVVAVDPDEHMLAQLMHTLPRVPVLIGQAEDLPLPDASADAVVLGQAWHWVQVDQASREVARVLRPGGTLGLLWNIRDERVDWVARLTDVIAQSAAERWINSDGPRVAWPFPRLDHARFEWTLTMRPETLQSMVRSRSSYIGATAEQRATIDRGLAALLETIPRDDDGAIQMPYVTHAFRARRP